MNALVAACFAATATARHTVLLKNVRVVKIRGAPTTTISLRPMYDVASSVSNVQTGIAFTIRASTRREN